MLWLALTVLAASAGLLVALPFLRTSKTGAGAPTTSLDVYKQQLDSVARDVKLGDVSPESAAELRTEIERRIVDAPTAPVAAAAATDPRFDRITAAAVALIVVLGSAVLYSATGAPGTPSAARGGGGPLQAGSQALPDVDTMIERLATRLQENPNDAEGWRMLGWSYFETSRFDQAVEAYTRAVELAPTEISYRSALAEAQTQANGGQVTPEAQRAFQQALSADRSDERAKYYLALARAQRGDVRGAVGDWIAAVNAAAPESEWASRMRAEAENAAREIGMNIAGRMPPAPVGVAAQAPPISSDTLAAAQQASPQAQQQMIAGMVDGLEQRLTQNPRDADGWVRLMRSRMVLGQPDRARAALQRGLQAFSDDPAVQRQLRSAAAELNVPGA